jgi:hypothetical protein
MADTSALLSELSHISSALLSTDTLIVSFITFVVYKVYSNICICFLIF